MPEFNIGDRVICLEDYPDDNEDVYTGCTGTVCRVQPDEDCGDIGVCWDSKVQGGHDCNGSCEYGYGWYVRPRMIKLDTEPDEPFEFNEDEFNKLVFGGEVAHGN